jgi:hypothetical protein
MSIIVSILSLTVYEVVSTPKIRTGYKLAKPLTYNQSNKKNQLHRKSDH